MPSTPEIAERAADVRRRLDEHGLTVADSDLDRPWGGFLVLEESQLDVFAGAFFAGARIPADDGRRSPKLLLVAPGRRLSWQYHTRRAELWRIVEGPVAISLSPDDTEPRPARCETGRLIRIAQGVRHRLGGLEGWGVVAEIWLHSDPGAPSDEGDIVRVHDDHGR